MIKWFKEISIKDVPQVGGKNASLGEMYRRLTNKGVKIPNGFATTAKDYWYVLESSGLKKQIKEILKDLDVKDIKNLARKGKQIRNLTIQAPLPKDFEKKIILAYRKLSRQYGVKAVDVAVRSSATAEDMPTASFAGQMETYLNIKGEKNLLKAVKKCIASLYTDRAIVYREEKGFNHLDVALSVCVQKMIRSDLACSGVIFSCHTESGFFDVSVITSSWGLGENIVQGKVSPDEFLVYEPLVDKFRPILGKHLGAKEWKMIYNPGGKEPVKNIRTTKKEQNKFTLSDDEILQLGKYSVIIEKYYSRSMDMEWAKDGKDKQLYILQARPETVQSQKSLDVLEKYILLDKQTKRIPSHGKIAKISLKDKIIVSGVAVGSRIANGQANIIESVKDISKFKPGQILVTEMTDPDWVPIMKIAKAIVTNAGGRTCFTGETNVLTNKGFLSIKEIVEKHKEEDYKVLSLNKESMNFEWKKVIDGMKRRSKPISVSISQTGRMKGNTLGVTPDHKFLTFENRKLISKEIRNLIKENQFILSADKIPMPERQHKLNPFLGYLLGGISSDGHIYLNGTHGEVQFIQKNTPDKADFIKKMNDCLKEVFDYSFHISYKKPFEGIIRGKKFKSENAVAYRCYSKKIASRLFHDQSKLTESLLTASDDFVYNFLAGMIDGDGAYNEKSNRINIYCSKEYLLQAITVACLRLNISFQVTSNRNIHNIQIVSKVEEIFKYTTRIKGKYNRLTCGTKFFSAKQLLEDIKDKINYKGKIGSYIEKNLLIDYKKIENYFIPMIAREQANHELTRIINSDLKMLRVNNSDSIEKQNVYNITVEDNHNYVVFSGRYTPVVVNNCHAAIISRELGIPCVVGTSKATKKVKQGQKITVSCAEGETAHVYPGLLDFKIKKTKIKGLKRPKTKIMMNIGEPEQAFGFSFIPNDGVGLAREEFIISDYIKIHPLALLYYSQLKDKKVKKQIDDIVTGYPSKVQFYVDKLSEGIARIAAAFYPKQVIVRFSDFKTNEYANLIGGQEFEPKEPNPMIGWRGASRYYGIGFEEAFQLECQAIKKVREIMGLDNVIVMVPFCRTIEEGKKVLKIIDKAGLRRPKKNIKPLKVYVMCEIPSNVVLADEFAKIFDGFSIGSNDLTQLTLGLDRDSNLVAHIFDERNEAVKRLISQVIKIAHKHKRKIGICGQGPSDFPEFARFLVKEGIDSMSLTPDTVIKTTIDILKTEKKLKKK